MKSIMGYEIVKKIGEGSYGTVYLVKKENAAGTFLRALKHISFPSQEQFAEIKSSFRDEPDQISSYIDKYLQKLLNEIRIQNQLSNDGNSHIVKYYDSEVVKSSDAFHYDIYILMEYLTPLKQYIVNNGMSEIEIIQMGIQILDAVKLCHEKNILHRDIKEDNIFVNDKNIFKLGDFGIAKYENRTNSLSWRMTINYSSPEVITQQEVYSESDDLYSLGMVLYKLLNHERFPFFPKYPQPYDEGDKENALHARIHYENIPYPDDCSNELAEIVLKALKPKQERYKSASDFKESLQNYCIQKGDKKKNLSEYSDLKKNDKTSHLSLDFGNTVKEKNKSKEIESTEALFSLPKNAELEPASDIKLSAKRELFSYTQQPVKNNLLLWIVPFVFLVILIVVIWCVVPAFLHTSGSFFSYLFENYDNLDFYGDMVPAYHTYLLLKFLTILFFSLFILSLFFAARSLNKTEKKVQSVIGGNIYQRLSALKDLSLLQECYQSTEIQTLFDFLLEKTRLNGELGKGNEEKEQVEMEIIGSIKRLDERVRQRDAQKEVLKELRFIRRKLTEREQLSYRRSK